MTTLKAPLFAEGWYPREANDRFAVIAKVPYVAGKVPYLGRWGEDSFGRLSMRDWLAGLPPEASAEILMFDRLERLAEEEGWRHYAHDFGESWFGRHTTSASYRNAIASFSWLGGDAQVAVCAIDENDRLTAFLGGSRVGDPRHAMLGSAFPALVRNTLTAAQTIADDYAQLHALVAAEVATCAYWWRAHPALLADTGIPELPSMLSELAAKLADRDHPAYQKVGANAYVRESPRLDDPRTTISVWPLAALTADAAGIECPLLIKPTAPDGLSFDLLADARSRASQR